MAMVNEALCKILCQNIVVLIHEMFEFWNRAGFYIGLRNSKDRYDVLGLAECWADGSRPN